MRDCIEGPVLKWAGRKRRVPSPWMRRYYIENVGPAHEGDHIHHRCGNPWCIEPSHLAALPPAAHRNQHSRPQTRAYAAHPCG